MNRTKLKHGLIDWVSIKGGKWQETIKTKSCKETGSVWIRAQFSTAHTSFLNLEGDSYRFSDLLASVFQTRKWVPSEIKNLFKSCCDQEEEVRLPPAQVSWPQTQETQMQRREVTQLAALDQNPRRDGRTCGHFLLRTKGEEARWPSCLL